jgi:hypothetical protein
MLFQRYAQKKYTKSPQSRDNLGAAEQRLRASTHHVGPPSHELLQPVICPVIVRQNFVGINEDEVSSA